MANNSSVKEEEVTFIKLANTKREHGMCMFKSLKRIKKFSTEMIFGVNLFLHFLLQIILLSVVYCYKICQ